MNPNRLTIFGLILASLVSGALGAIAIQERKTKQVTRVKRPIFTQRDWDGIYFENLFTDGLVGERPAASSPGVASPEANSQLATVDEPAMVVGEITWSNLIGRTTIEDEVKAIQKNLTTDISTPVKFKSDYAKAHQSFSMLSMIFGVIREYDTDVRWQDAAASAQTSFERAAANSRVGTSQAFESCKRRAESLAELVRGGKFTGEETPAETMDWSVVVERAPLMERLGQSMEQLKMLTASKADFTRDAAVVNHESEMIAAIAAVLIKENMTDADDSGYAAFAAAMQKSALATTAAVKSQDYDAASRAVNGISQSCDNCHSEWR